MVDDLFIGTFLKLNVKFFSGQDQLKLARRMHKKVISMALPPGIELVLAADAVPIFLCRVGDYSSQSFLRTARLYQNFVGWDLLARGVRFLRPLLGDRFFSDMIDQFLTTLYNTYEKYVAIAESEGTPLDACFGTRLLLGATWPNLKDIQGTLGYGTRCNWFSKVFEEVEQKSPLVFIEIPNSNSDYAEEMMVDSLNQAIAKLEQITGSTITNEKLRKKAMITNEIRESYLKILEIWSKDKIRLHPLTFTNLLSLLHIGYTDFLCDPKFFSQTLHQLATDLQHLKNGGFNTGLMPKLILVNAFGGYEPHLPEIMDNLGGRLLIADWEVLRILDKIDVNNGNMLQNYVHYLMGFESTWFDNTALVNRYIAIASKYKVDGILFNSLYGCKSITPSLKLFKTKLQEMNFALVDIGFQNVGDNIEQLKTRIGAILEIIREQKG